MVEGVLRCGKGHTRDKSCEIVCVTQHSKDDNCDLSNVHREVNLPYITLWTDQRIHFNVIENYLYPVRGPST
jgi:hypothetical protein